MGKSGILQDAHIFSLESLKEALEELENITENKRQISIQDYDGTSLSSEQLFRKYFDEKGDPASLIDPSKETSLKMETEEEIEDSHILPDYPINTGEDSE